MTRADIFQAIEQERDRQEGLWHGKHDWGTGSCASPDIPPEVKVMVLTEEVGEVAAAVLDRASVSLRTELVQVAAVAVAWLEALEPKSDDLTVPLFEAKS